jgi:DNA-binding NarL/FixJ family response regulator
VPLPVDDETVGPLQRLTPREKEVLELLIGGATDKDIAEALVISPRTASVHVSNIISKLEVTNRGSAVAFARRDNR